MSVSAKTQMISFRWPTPTSVAYKVTSQIILIWTPDMLSHVPSILSVKDILQTALIRETSI